MKTTLRFLLPALVLAAVASGATQNTISTANMPEALKKIAARYAVTDKRIAALTEGRQHPAPLPDRLISPFSRVISTDNEAGLAAAAEAQVLAPLAEDNDEETVVKIGAALRISGLFIRNGQPQLTINSTVCKTGDMLPVQYKGHTVYVQIRALTPDLLTIGLNEATHAIPLKR